MAVKDFITINITRQTRGVSRQGFGYPMFLSEHDAFTDRVRAYTSIASVEDDFAVTSLEYQVAQKFWSQDIGPERIYIGRKEADESWTEAASAVQDAEDDWYFLTASTHDSDDIQELAAWVETQEKLYGTSYADLDAQDPAIETDPGFILNQQVFDRTFLVWSEDANDEYPEASYIGLQAPKDPGSTTWKFRELTGVTPSTMSPTAKLTLAGDKFASGKGYNVYTREGGRNMMSEGKVVSGEFIDTMRFVDWLRARMREAIFARLMNSEKIPFTNEGFAIIEGEMRKVLQRGVAVGGLSSFTVTVPDARSLDFNERANRVATGFRFEGILAGAIHFVGIDGTVTV